MADSCLFVQFVEFVLKTVDTRPYMELPSPPESAAVVQKLSKLTQREPSSIHAQGVNWLDTRGRSGWQEARRRRDDRQERTSRGKRQRIPD